VRRADDLRDAFSVVPPYLRQDAGAEVGTFAEYGLEQTRPFRKDDESRFWFLDFHWPRGFTPMGAATWCEDGYCWGTQHAAEGLPLLLRRRRPPASRATSPDPEDSP